MEVVNDGKDIVFYSSNDDAISVTLENAVGKALTFDNNDRRSSVTFDFSTDTIVAEKSYSGFMYENSSDESILHSSWVGHDFVTVDGRNLKNGTTIQGNLLDNVIYGSTKSDTIYGEAGNDTIYGGAGNNTLYGGVGNDIFCFNEADGTGSDMIYDYEFGSDLIGIDSEGMVASSDISGNDLILTFTNDRTVTVLNAAENGVNFVNVN